MTTSVQTGWLEFYVQTLVGVLRADKYEDTALWNHDQLSTAACYQCFCCCCLAVSPWPPATCTPTPPNDHRSDINHHYDTTNDNRYGNATSVRHHSLRVQWQDVVTVRLSKDGLRELRIAFPGSPADGDVPASPSPIFILLLLFLPPPPDGMGYGWCR